MKALTLGFLTLISTSYSMASNTELESMVFKIDSHLNEIKNAKRFSQPAAIPWDVIEERERNLFVHILKGYELLKAQNQNTRYTYLYEAVAALSKSGPARIEALMDWNRAENVRAYSFGLSSSFYSQWKEIVSNIQLAINKLSSEKPIVDLKESNAKFIQPHLSFLKTIRDDIDQVSSKLNSAKPTEAKPKVESNDFAFNDDFQMIMMGILSATTFLIGFIIRGGKAEIKKTAVQEQHFIAPEPKKVILPELPIIATPSQAEIVYMVNLEEKTNFAMSEARHLFEIAGLKVNQNMRSPFNTAVNAPADKVSEALNWLIKGTIAIANTSEQKASHIEWNCKEQSGRVCLELILHGVEANTKSLYLNALTDGDGSAPAHFGRSEMALSGHLASVGIKTGGKRTTVSLGLDSRSATMTH